MNEFEKPKMTTGSEFFKTRSKETAMRWWQEENPGQPVPADEEALYRWIVEKERADFIEVWREAHPGQPLPDDYAQVW